jgi:tRNA(fMet)-specific endonuclease VapC
MPSNVGYLLDTNVLVAIVRGKTLGEAIDSRFGLRSAINRSMICIVTAGEVLSLARQFAWGQSKRDELQAILDEVVWIDINHLDIIDAYAEIDFASRSQGRKMGKNDVWIAATAKVSKTILLTTDQDFDHLQNTYIHRIWIDPETKQPPP